MCVCGLFIFFLVLFQFIFLYSYLFVFFVVLDRAEEEIRERLAENVLQVQIIETVRSAKPIPSIERIIEKL